MKNQKGFSLIELLIVVVIIGIIAAIAIPNLLAARRSANEGSAQSTSRTLHSAQVTFSATVGNGNYSGGASNAGSAVTFNGNTGQAAMGGLNGQSLIDSQLASGAKSGYNYLTFATDRAVGTREASFKVGANALQGSGVGQTGTRRFCAQTDGVVRSTTTTPGTALTTSGATADQLCDPAVYTNVVQ